MKRKKTLIIYYIITLLLSFISLFSFNQKGKDFFIALSSISADLTLIISVILVTYSLFYCVDYIKERINKKDKLINLKLIISLLILLFTLIVIFISFVNIFAHKNIFEFFSKANDDIIDLFIKSILAYFFIYLFAVIGIIASIKSNQDEPFLMTLIAVLVLVSILYLIKVLLGIRLLYFIIVLDIILFIVVNILLKKGKKKK